MSNIKNVLSTWKYLKKKYPTHVLLFKSPKGYYESYNKDAKLIATAIGNLTYEVSLSKNGKKVTATSFPCSDLDEFLPKMIHAGLKVAVCNPD